jgi:UDP-3-O-[3-hydroxymyristoyl] glucosamine N-acyltransferase
MIRKDIQPIKVKEVTSDYVGNGDFLIKKVSGLSSCDKTGMAFYKGQDISFVQSSEVGVLIVNELLRESIEEIDFICEAIIFSKNPMLFFTTFVNERFDNNFTDTEFENKHNLELSSNAYIESEVVIGEHTKVFPNATILNGTTIGKNCTIQSNTVIAGIGMSYVQDDSNSFTRLTHLGDVIIEDNVDIGCNTTVLKGILESTIIKKGAKIGNQVNIGHNSVIGENTYISAGAVVGGATIVGKNCWIAPGVTIRDNIKIGDNCTLGLGCVVVKDTEPNSVYIGNPASLYKRKEIE